MADTTVKLFHAGMVGAPQMSGTAGSLIGVLDACLVNGWGAGNLDSLVIANGVATATRSAGHSQIVDGVALISGATVTGGTINGEQRVTAVTTTTFQFACPGIPDQVATGTISQKVAPMGWTKPLTGTNLAAYKSSDPQATGCVLRVDDTATTVARARGYESMSDINTGIGPFPTDAQRNGGVYWTKSNSANTGTRFWILIGDGRSFYLAREYNNVSYIFAYEVGFFGDLVPTKASGDPFACAINGESADRTGAVAQGADSMQTAHNSSYGEVYCPRSYTGLGGSVKNAKTAPGLWGMSGSNASGGCLNASPFPNPTDGGLYVVPMYVTEQNTLALRGTFPGYGFVPMNVPVGMFAPLNVVTGISSYPGRRFSVVTNYGGGGTPFSAPMLFDVTGPWR